MDLCELDNRPFCACSTPSGTAGIAVIRLSGEGSSLIADKCIKIVRAYDESVKVCSQMPGYTACYARFEDPADGRLIDNVIVMHFVAPHSYTGDEMFEISCHGGSAVKQEILSVLESNGARPAGRGEFTKRAFINGKLDLAEAEAVMDVINADSARALDAANSQIHGDLSSKLDMYEKKLYEALALIEMIVEFPEHDDTPENTDKITEICRKAVSGLDSLIRSYSKGRMLTERMKIVLCGKPNSGKSTLLNAIAGFDRAIVTDTPGTTRDTLELQADIASIPVTVVDTAGLRDTSDEIEEMGIRRAVTALSEADLVFYLIAPDEDVSSVEENLRDMDPNKTKAVFTKSDEGDNPHKKEIEELIRAHGINDFVEISAKSGLNMDLLEQEVRKTYEAAGGLLAENILIMSKRHADALTSASDKLNSAIEAVEGGLGVDIASSVIRSALDDLGAITGKTVSAELADTIFSRFCIGK